MRSDPSGGTAKPEKRTWQQMVAKYQNPSLQRSLWQVANTLIPYFVLLTLMYVSLSYSYWITLALALPAGGLLTRSFIIFHDCGHGSFFKSQRANNLLGTICGLMVFTPYYQWRFEHAVHHATSGDLDRRGVGDIFTLTVDEYLKLPRWGRYKYRLYRSPIVMLGLGPWFTFLISQRFVNPISKKRERFSVYFSNLFIVALLVVAAHTIGIKELLMIQLPVAFIGGLGGIWMFYIQHQFEGTSWSRDDDWSFHDAALHGSSYYHLPGVLRWFTANIGIHNIHHLSSRIPCYRLPDVLRDHPHLTAVGRITLLQSLRYVRLALWDEGRQQLISFGEAVSRAPAVASPNCATLSQAER